MFGFCVERSQWERIGARLSRVVGAPVGKKKRRQNKEVMDSRRVRVLLFSSRRMLSFPSCLSFLFKEICGGKFSPTRTFSNTMV